MRSTLLASSSYGKFIPTLHTPTTNSIRLQTPAPLSQLTLTLSADRLYLLNGKGHLICLFFQQQSVSTLTTDSFSHFTLLSHNPYALLATNNKHELIRIGFHNKSTEKVMNLNLIRPKDLSLNQLTKLALIVETRLTLVVDYSVKNGGRLQSLKPPNGSLFLSGRFLNQNRWIVLVVKDTEGVSLWSVEVHGMKVVSKIRLQVDIKDARLEPSLDGQTISIFGQSNWLFLARVSSRGQIATMCTEIPVRSILAVKFTIDQNILFLGNDHTLYAIPAPDRNLVVPLFNQDSQLPIKQFDVSLDGKLIVCTTGSTVVFVRWEQGIKKVIQETRLGIEIEFRGKIGNQVSGNASRQIQYDEEQDHKDDLPEESQIQQLNTHNQRLLLPSDLPSFTASVKKSEMVPELRYLALSHEQAATTHQIYSYLHNVEQARELVHLHRQAAILFIIQARKQASDAAYCATVCYTLFKELGVAIKSESLLQQFRSLAPRVVEKVHHILKEDFELYISRCFLSNFSNYLSPSSQQQLFALISSNAHRSGYLPMLLISLLLNLKSESSHWPHPFESHIKLRDVAEDVEKLMSQPKTAFLRAKEPQLNEGEPQDLEALLEKQEKLRSELAGLKQSA